MSGFVYKGGKLVSIKARIDKAIEERLLEASRETAQYMSDSMPSKSDPYERGGKPGGYPGFYYGGLLNSSKYGITAEVRPRDKSALVGPLKKPPTAPVRNSRGIIKVIRPVNKTVPQLLNEGGPAVMTITYPDGKTSVQTVRYNSYPFVSLTAPFAAKMLREAFKKQI